MINFSGRGENVRTPEKCVELFFEELVVVEKFSSKIGARRAGYFLEELQLRTLSLVVRRNKMLFRSRRLGVLIPFPKYCVRRNEIVGTVASVFRAAIKHRARSDWDEENAAYFMYRERFMGDDEKWPLGFGSYPHIVYVYSRALVFAV